MNGKLPSSARARSEEEEEASSSAATAHNVNCSKAARGGPRAGPRPPSLRSKPDGDALHNASKGPPSAERGKCSGGGVLGQIPNGGVAGGAELLRTKLLSVDEVRRRGGKGAHSKVLNSKICSFCNVEHQV